MNGQNAIRTQDLCKQYGEFQAVVNVNLEVLQGEIFSLRAILIAPHLPHLYPIE